MNVDPLASMRCWEIELELGGRTFVVPALSAVHWWPVLVEVDPELILDMILSTPESEDLLEEILLSGMTGVRAVLIEAIEEATGRSFHASALLARVAADNWPVVNGQLAQHGFRWDVQPIGAALDAIFSVVTSSLNEEKLAEFMRLLDNEPVVNGKVSNRQREKVASDFESMAGPRPSGGVRAIGAPSDNARSRTRTPPRPPRQGDP